VVNLGIGSHTAELMEEWRRKTGVALLFTVTWRNQSCINLYESVIFVSNVNKYRNPIIYTVK
jgi:hypothetical protein